MSTLVWCPNPGEVEMQLRQTGIVYPRNVKEVNRGYGEVQAIPLLYRHISDLGEVPTPEQLCRYLWQYRDHELEARFPEEVKKRTIKLVLDFFRELHTFGLIAKHNAFGLVRYAKAVDIDKGVDYLAKLSSMYMTWQRGNNGEVGIQSAVGAPRSYERDGYWQKKKERRRSSRGATAWSGPLYWLTNEHRPAVISKPSHCWLFTWEHIKDLVDEIVNAPAIAIQMAMRTDTYEDELPF